MANNKFNLSKGEEKRGSNFNLSKSEKLKADKFSLSKSQTTSTSDNPKKRKSKWWLWLLLAIVVIVIVIFCVKNVGMQAKVDEISEVVEIANEEILETEEQSAIENGEQPAIAPAQEQATQANTTTENPADKPAQSERPTDEPATSTSSTTIPQGTLEEKAKSVIRGDFGNGAERRRKLGSEYEQIQSKVNEMYRNNQNY